MENKMTYLEYFNIPCEEQIEYHEKRVAELRAGIKIIEKEYPDKVDVIPIVESMIKYHDFLAASFKYKLKRAQTAAKQVKGPISSIKKNEIS